MRALCCSLRRFTGSTRVNRLLRGTTAADYRKAPFEKRGKNGAIDLAYSCPKASM